MVNHVEVWVSIKGERVEKARTLWLIQVLNNDSIILIFNVHSKTEITIRLCSGINKISKGINIKWHIRIEFLETHNIRWEPTQIGNNVASLEVIREIGEVKRTFHCKLHFTEQGYPTKVNLRNLQAIWFSKANFRFNILKNFICIVNFRYPYQSSWCNNINFMKSMIGSYLSQVHLLIGETSVFPLKCFQEYNCYLLIVVINCSHSI